MPRWIRLVPALLVYAVIMAVVGRTIHVWALPPDERTFETIATRMVTLFAFAVVSAFVVYRLFVRTSGGRQDVR